MTFLSSQIVSHSHIKCSFLNTTFISKLPNLNTEARHRVLLAKQEEMDTTIVPNTLRSM